jgi:signal transduction histidine kinase
MIQFIDVTKSVLLEKQKAEGKSMEIANACVSHELRNPLNSIVSNNLERRMLCSQLKQLVEDK